MAKDSPFDRALPSNIEAERSILGAILLDNQTINQAAEMLRRDDFFLDSHRRIYDKMLHLMEQGRAIDPITLQDALRQAGDLELIGGAAFIGALIDGVPRFSNIEEYCRIVKGQSTVRRLITTSNQIMNRCFDAEDTPDVLLEEAERAILAIGEDRIRQGFVPISEVAHKQLQHIEEIAGREQLVTGIATGFRDLDYMTSGLQRGDLIIIAARPSMGKCVAHDAEIVLEDGSLVTIEEIYQRQAARLLTLNDNWKLSFTAPSAFVDDGIKPVFKVTTKLGRTVESTITHPFLTFDGWRKLGELKVGDKIAVLREVNVFGTQKLSDEELASLVESIAADHHAIPATIFQLTRPQLALFLHHLFAANDWRSVATQRQGETHPFLIPDSRFPVPAYKSQERFGGAGVRSQEAGIRQAPLSYCTSNERLARQVQHLLLRFGIIAQLGQQPKPEKGAMGWRLEITQAASIRRFLAEINVVPQALSPLDGHGDIYWDEIVAIEFIGAKQVYDLTIPHTHNFVANDICVHNTAFCLNIAQNAAMKQQHHGNKAIVGIFSLEMSKEQLVQRMLCAQARIDAHRLRTGMLSKEDWRHLAMGVSELAEAQIFLDDTPAISSLEMRAKIRRLRNEQRGLDLIIVDYLQLMSGKGRVESRQQEVSQISRELKAIAKEMNVPLIALSQLSRAVESRSDHRPQLSDLRESGCLAGESLVTLADTGERVPIKDLVGKSGVAVWALNEETWKLERAVVSRAFATGVKPVWRLTTRLGRSIRATANHKFRTFAGWRRLDELQIGERLALPRALPSAAVQFRPEVELALPGHLISDRAACVAHAVYSELLRKLAESDVYWDQVVAIEPGGETEVFDLTVPGLHNFEAEGFIVHNSLEQDADLVMFIYRDEVYNPETEKQNVAEIIIGKQRNGPIGDVELVFLKQLTRFEDKYRE
jgi:replicative DNA helicase